MLLRKQVCLGIAAVSLIASTARCRASDSAIPKAPPAPLKAIAEIELYAAKCAKAAEDARARFAYSFTPAQSKRMAAGGWVRYSELTAGQKALYLRSSRPGTANVTEDIRDLRLFLKQTPEEVKSSLRSGTYLVQGDKVTQRGGMNSVTYFESPSKPMTPPKGKPIQMPAEKDYPAGPVATLRKYGRTCADASYLLHKRWLSSFTTKQKAQMSSGTPVKFTEMTQNQQQMLVSERILNNRGTAALFIVRHLEERTKPVKVSDGARQPMFQTRKVKEGIWLREVRGIPKVVR